MLKNVAGIWFYSETSTTEWSLRTYDLGNGHLEAVVSRPTVWREMDPETAQRFGKDWQELLDKRSEEEAEERRQANLKRSARRAKTNVRRKIKSMGLDAMLTLTYRANQTDLSLCKAHMKEFVRRIRRVLPGFAYVACFEQQERGAWHVHMATHRVPKELPWGTAAKVKSFNVVRAIWRSVTGELEGNIDMQARKRRSMQSTAKLASYLSKYMLKAFEDGDDWQNRYSASSHQLPEAVQQRFEGAALIDVLSAAYGLVQGPGWEASGWLNKWGDLFYLSAERPPDVLGS